MITFPLAIQNLLNTKTGTQPILVLEIDWLEGATIAYSDTEYTGASSKLISVGTIDRVQQSQTSNQLSVVLDSTEEIVETIFRSNDIHLRPARLYLAYSSTTEKALLFDGLINSNIVWDEAGRTLQFEILSKLEDSLVGFAMEDGNFPLVSQDDRGKNWPLPFGTVCHYQSQRLTTTIKGFLLEGLGAVDPTLPNRICQIEKTTCPLITRPVLRAGSTPNSVVTSEDVPDPACLSRKRNEGCILKDLLAKQQALSTGVFTVKGGATFPQNQRIKIRIGAVSYRGTMVGETFTVSQVYHPDQSKAVNCKTIRAPAFGYRNTIGSEDDANACSDQGKNANAGPVSGVDCITATSFGVGGNFYSSCGFNTGGSQLEQIVAGGAAASWDYYDQMPTGQFIWAPPGTDVILQEFDDDLVYMVSLLPGTVTQVVAYRTFGDQKLLSQVPTDWYTVANVNYGGYQCVELRFNTLPSSSDQPGWEDDIYVSFVSSIGPSPVDIIEWLVDTYTGLTVDSTNFAAVKSTLTEFDSNFVVQDRPSVLALINEIAYQQRMAVRINNDIVSLVYLGEEPTSERTFTSADLVQSSFKLNYTETEKLRTNLEVTWKEQYASNIKSNKVEKDLVLRYNIPKYGSTTEALDWFTQNTFDTVLKTTTFWLIRQSNTWQEVEFETSLEHLDLDILDSITLNISEFPNTKVVLTEKRYNSDSNSISWKAWTPIRAGESAAYYWAWPAAVTSNKWPLAGTDEDQVGDGSGLTVVPPVDHPLRVGYVGGESIPVSTGDPFPSDVGFVAPTVTCETPLGNEVVFAQTPIIDPLAKANFNNDMQNKQNGNGGGVSISYEREERPCDTGLGFINCPFEVGDPPVEEEPEEGDCKYYVELSYLIPTLVRNNGCSGPCKSDTVTPGFACNGNVVTVISEVSNYPAAEAAVTNHNAAWQNASTACQSQIGVIQPNPGATIKSYDSNNVLWTNSRPPSCNADHEDRPQDQLTGSTTDSDIGDNDIPEPTL